MILHLGFQNYFLIARIYFLLNQNELITAGKIAKKLISFKKKGSGKHNLKNILNIQKDKFNKFYNIKIEYLELRNEANLKISNKLKGSKIFIAYHLGKVRLIDNF